MQVQFLALKDKSPQAILVLHVSLLPLNIIVSRPHTLPSAMARSALTVILDVV